MVMLVIILYLTNFLRTLLFFVILYYLIRAINRYVLPLFRASQSSRQPGNGRERRPEGDVRVENNRRQGSRIPRDEGEYVDFEEID